MERAGDNPLLIKEPTGCNPWACEELLTEPSPCLEANPSISTDQEAEIFKRQCNE
jgi:hypothetical protein